MRAKAHRSHRARNEKAGAQIFSIDIHSSQLAREAKTRIPLGFCVGIGAPKSLIGRKELNRVMTRMGKYKRKIVPSTNRFRFGDVTFESRGKVSLPMKTSTGVTPILVEMDIVDADVPALLGMDVLDRECLAADKVQNHLIRKYSIGKGSGTTHLDEWSIPMTRSDSDHVYVEMDFETSVHFTRSQLY